MIWRLRKLRGEKVSQKALPLSLLLSIYTQSILFHYLYPVILEEAHMQERARAHAERAHAEQIGGI